MRILLVRIILSTCDLNCASRSSYMGTISSLLITRQFFQFASVNDVTNLSYPSVVAAILPVPPTTKACIWLFSKLSDSLLSLLLEPPALIEADEGVPAC